MTAIDWKNVRRVLVVRLRSIGDTVLATPSLIALRRFLPEAQIDILLEDWVAPLLDGFDAVSNVVSYGKGTLERLHCARRLSRSRYDVAFNLHGGTTATFFTVASRARHRVGLGTYQFKYLYDHILASPADFWQRQAMHSAEQQLALLGFVGVPVDDRPKSRLTVTDAAAASVSERLAKSLSHGREFALIHPASAFITKQWSTGNFARTAEFLADLGFHTIAVASKAEAGVLESLRTMSRVPVTTFDDLSLPEVTALASRAKLFVGNDSGVAHIAAAVQTPTVVIFGSSNRVHWRPWTDASNKIVYEEFSCQPCPGYECAQFGEPRCILNVNVSSVTAAIKMITVREKAGT